MQTSQLAVGCLILGLMTACSSAPKSADNHFGEEKVLSRIDDMSSRPDWLKESDVFKVENGKVFSLGSTVIPADHNVSAAYRIAANSAKGLIAGAIEQRLDFIFQQASESTEVGNDQAHFIGAEASKLTSSSLRNSKVYWEKRAITDASGNVRLETKVFALVEMPEQDFKLARGSSEIGRIEYV